MHERNWTEQIRTTWNVITDAERINAVGHWIVPTPRIAFHLCHSLRLAVRRHSFFLPLFQLSPFLVVLMLPEVKLWLQCLITATKFFLTPKISNYEHWTCLLWQPNIDNVCILCMQILPWASFSTKKLHISFQWSKQITCSMQTISTRNWRRCNLPLPSFPSLGGLQNILQSHLLVNEPWPSNGRSHG